MSITATSYVLNHRFGSSTRKLIMIGIADFANDSGEAWPSIDTLAQRAECSRRTVQESIRQLEKDGDLQIRPNAGQNGCHRYRIIFRKTEASYATRNLSKTDRAKSAPPQSFEQVQNSDAQTARGGADDRPPSAPEPLRTVIEPSRERETRTPAQIPAEFSEEDFCDTIEFVSNLRPGWTANFSAKERAAFAANADCLRSIQPPARETIRRFLSARLPQGHGYWQPKTRMQFLTDASDVLAHALNWESKQPRPIKPKLATPTPEEPPLTPEEMKAILAGKSSTSSPH
jgi:hypothetical protein